MNNLKALREAKGLTQEQLATVVGTTKAYISKFETGTRDLLKSRYPMIKAICDALGCTEKELFSAIELEWDEEGHMLVDCAFEDPRFYGKYIFIINGNYFMVRSNFKAQKDKTTIKDLQEAHCSFATENIEDMEDNSIYIFTNTYPKKGIIIPLGRAITNEELKTFRKKHKIDDDHISGEFVESKGAVYGKKYMITYTSIQVAVDEYIAMELESELQNKGIEAFNGSAGRINIRVK